VLFSWPFLTVLLPLMPFAQLAFFGVFNTYPVIQKYIINPYYESRGEKNPEIPDYNDSANENQTEKTALFTDLGGKESPIDKKKVKSTGKIIK
ncbi:MAG: hypothetical protein FWG33_03670, partial [Oscillospiraceae bacterium]|nr:hypothetical protein [Oscillospiraceae bacterium]